MPIGVSARALRAWERGGKQAACLAVAVTLFSQPALSQAGGPGPMAPMPRVAPPPPPPPPPAPPVMAPTSPGMQPGLTPSVAPRKSSTSSDSGGGNTTTSPDNSSPTPQGRAPATTGGGTIKAPDNNSPTPQNRTPAPTKGGTAGRAPPAAAPVAPSVDRSTAIASASRGLLPARDVAIVSTDGSGGARTEVRTNDKGQFSFGSLSPGVRDVTFPVTDLQRALPDGGAKKRLPSVTVSLVIPVAPGGGARGNLVVHTYSRVDPNKDIRTKITVPRDGSGAIVDWGDGTPPVNVVRDGWPIDVGGGRGPVETIGTISFVPQVPEDAVHPPHALRSLVAVRAAARSRSADGRSLDRDSAGDRPAARGPHHRDRRSSTIRPGPRVTRPRLIPPKFDPPKIGEKGTSTSVRCRRRASARSG